MAISDPQTMGVILGSAVLIIIEELKWGVGRKFYHERRRRDDLAKNAHEKIGRVLDRTEQNSEKLDEVSESVQDLHHTVAYLHREEIKDEPLARDRLRIDADDDLLQGD